MGKASKNINTKWNTQLSNIDCLVDFMDAENILKVDNAKVAAFHAWANEIDNLGFLLRRSKSASLNDGWIKRLNELTGQFRTQFENLYLTEKISQLPPKWVAEKYKSIKPFF